ncbi:HK97 family phage prohead protease [Arthrobacter sp. HLT1-21]
MDLEELTNDAGLMVRSFTIRSKDTAKREFTGIGVPYGETYDLGYGYSERFEPGAIELDGTKIFWQHREVIGRATAGNDTEAGFEVTGKVSDTAVGRDAWTLLEDGAVDSLSIGFIPVDYRTEKDDDGNITVIHTKVKAREFSLVNFPAYTTAKVSSIRSAAPASPKGSTMPPEVDTLTRADLQPVLDGQQELERALASLQAGNAAEAPAIHIPAYRSIGEFVRAVANRDEEALTFHAELTNREAPANVLADAIVKESWVGDYIKLVEERRRIFNTFGRGTLPATGMTIEYGKLLANTTVVGEQLLEGDNLAGPGKVSLKIENAEVHTVGGWSSMSFQAIQRATIPTLNTLWKAMMLKYAAGTEARVRAEYFAIIAAHIAANTADPLTERALTIAPGATTNEWLDLIVDAALIYEERGFLLEGMHASIDQFKILNRLTDGDGRRLMNVYGSGMNQVGELNLKRADGTLANVPVSLVGTRATREVLSFYDPTAIETLESPGAPVQLQDENIINLTKQLSLYGYVAVTNPFPEAILPVKIAAPAAAGV